MAKKKVSMCWEWTPVSIFVRTLCSFSLEMCVSVELVTGAMGWHYLFRPLHQSVMEILESCLVWSDHLCLGSLVETERGNTLWCLLWQKCKIINNIFILWVSDAIFQSRTLFWCVKSPPCKLIGSKSCSSWILNMDEERFIGRYMKNPSKSPSSQ